MVGSEKILRIFILSVLIIFTASCDLLNCKNKLYIKSDHAYGIKEGGSVIINGLKIGQVSDIKYLPPADMIIELEVDEHIQIPRNSTYALNSIYFYENGSIEIFPPVDAVEYCINNDTLLNPNSKSTSLEDIIMDKLKTDPLLFQKIKKEILELEL